MYKKILFLLLPALLFGSFANAQNENKRYFELNKNIEIFNSIVKELDMFYVDSLDAEKSVQNAINGMLGNLDPYTTYIVEEQMDDFKFMTTGEYAGIGAYIQPREYKGKIAVMITGPQENMPAAKAGLKAGDVILEVDGIDMVREGSLESIGQSLSDSVRSKLKGTAQTILKIKVDRPGSKRPIEFKVTRDKIHVDAVTYHDILEDGIGYISFSTFTDKSADEVKAAFLELKKRGMTSLILDIRNNGGGLMEDAIQIANLFVPKGQIVLSTKGKTKQMERIYRTTLNPIDTEIPLIILVNRGSASSSEILSGALQDMDRAVIVGQRTYGKGLVQVPRELPYGGSLKVTTSKYYIPSGRCVQAIDYTNRNEDGSVGRIPDSLTTVFKTANGREVRDGGGVTPDIQLEAERIPNIVYYLAAQNIIFDFATDFAAKNAKVAPAKSFNILDKDYDLFKEFVKTKDFKYDRGSEKAVKALKEIMEFEGYMKTSEAEFKALEAKLLPNLDQDLDSFKETISKYLDMEIVKRYYYDKGESEIELRSDKELTKAIEVLKDKDLYTKTLLPKQEK